MSTPLQQQLTSRGIDAAALTKSGFDEARAGELLSGADATITEVRKIASYFKIPIRSLIAEIIHPDFGQFKLRENLRAKGSADFEIFELLDRAEALSKIVPERPDKRFFVTISQDEKTFIAAENLAAFCREQVFSVDLLSPLIDLEDKITSLTSANIIVGHQRNIEGSVVSYFDSVFIFLSERPDPRMRFTLAHELCHYLCDITSGGNAWFDEDTLNPSGNFKHDEHFANSFAAALLLPPPGVGQALNSFRDAYELRDKNISDVEIMFLARFFGVSFQVAGRRLEDLGVLPRGAGQSLYDVVIKNFKSPEKFAEEIGLPPREDYDWLSANRRVARESHSVIANGGISVGRLAELIDLPINDVLRSAGQ